jgi:hypothetical protein
MMMKGADKDEQRDSGESRRYGSHFEQTKARKMPAEQPIAARTEARHRETKGQGEERVDRFRR